MKEKILVVEDDPGICKVITLYLKQNDYAVVAAGNGAQALHLVKAENPDLIIMDILLPDTNGIALCAEISKSANMPIIFLSSKQEDDDIIAGLKSGGVDYMTKPFNPSVLMARVEANLRRLKSVSHSDSADDILRYDAIEVHLKSGELWLNGLPVQIFAKELKLLIFFMRHPNHLFSPDELFEQVWGEHSIGSDATVMVHVSNLRKKIEPDPRNPRYIVTVKGLGYKFNTKSR